MEKVNVDYNSDRECWMLILVVSSLILLQAIPHRIGM